MELLMVSRLRGRWGLMEDCCGGATPGQQGQPGLPGQFPVQVGGRPGQVAGHAGFSLCRDSRGFNPTQNQFKIDQNGQLVPLQPTQTGAVINSQTGGVQNSPLPGQPQQQGQPGMGFGGNGLAMNPGE